MLAQLWRRLRSSVVSLPTLSGWGFSAIVALVVGATLYLVATLTGVAAWTPSSDSPWMLAITALFVPALGEELFFRGILVPQRGESARPAIWIATSLVAFVLWHVVEAATIAPGARLFATPEFLVCAALLGAACTAMRYHTGSLWPGVIFHAAIVWAWQLWFGGLRLAEAVQAA